MASGRCPPAEKRQDQAFRWKRMPAPPDARADLCQQQGESLQEGSFHHPGKTVSQDTNEGSGDVDHRRAQRLRGGQLDDRSQCFGRLLFLLRAAGEDPLSQHRQNTGHTLRKKKGEVSTTHVHLHHHQLRSFTFLGRQKPGRC